MFSSYGKRGVIAIRILIIAIVLVIILNILSTNVIAFGISTPYLENDVLKVNPGKHYTYSLNIQNGDDQDYYVDIIYSSTSNVVTLRETTYYVPSNTYDNKFYFDINIPANAKIAETYVLDYSAKPRVNSTDTIPLGVEIKRRLMIRVTDEKVLDIPATISPQEALAESSSSKSSSILLVAKRYLFPIIILIAVILLLLTIFMRIWTLSHGLSSKLSNERVTSYPISRAMNLTEVEELLKKMRDEEYDLEEIKELLEKKLSELTTNNIIYKINELSRRELIKIIGSLK